MPEGKSFTPEALVRREARSLSGRRIEQRPAQGKKRRQRRVAVLWPPGHEHLQRIGRIDFHRFEHDIRESEQRQGIRHPSSAPPGRYKREDRVILVQVMNEFWIDLRLLEHGG